ncbi:MAG: DMT family transporter [Clostridiales bacterium]|nr:DMT family transporter [Clostridiales bacterium]
MKTKNKSILAELGLLFITIIWGSAFVVVKNATDSVPVNYIIAVRFGIACLLLLIFFFPRIKKIDLRAVKSGAILGSILYLAYFLQTVGVKYTTAGNNAFLTAVYVVIVPFLYWGVKGEKPKLNHILAAFVCITGIGFLSLHANLTMNPGDILTLLCGLAFAAHIVAMGILTKKTDPILLSFTQFFFTTVLSLPAALATETFPAHIGTDMVLSFLYIGVFSTLVAMVLQSVCQQYVPPAKASLIMSLEALFGTVFGIIFLREQLTFKTLLGFALIFAAVLISETQPSFLRVLRKNRLPDELSAESDIRTP